MWIDKLWKQCLCCKKASVLVFCEIHKHHLLVHWHILAHLDRSSFVAIGTHCEWHELQQKTGRVWVCKYHQFLWSYLHVVAGNVCNEFSCVLTALCNPAHSSTFTLFHSEMFLFDTRDVAYVTWPTSVIQEPLLYRTNGYSYKCQICCA